MLEMLEMLQMVSSVDFSALLRAFVYSRTLASSPQFKNCAVLGTIYGQDAIVSLEKTHFDLSPNGAGAGAGDGNSLDLSTLIDLNNISLIQNNDVYFWSLSLLNQSLTQTPSVKLNLIYPATSQHIKKFDAGDSIIITETPYYYSKYVKPYIETMKGDRIKWVHNILYNNAESDKVIIKKENDFVLLPDMKWDGKTLDNLYLILIPYNGKEISSIRDIKREKHLDWLISILNTIQKEIPIHYNHQINANQLRIFVHYQPSYYHFHIHITNLKNNGLGNQISIGKAILLQDIIENLQNNIDYSTRNITYFIPENHQLWSNTGFKQEYETQDNSND
ncbi:scavenger mRNA decapping enzyme [Ascoidea rubescens DSM 1968]|uniref:Scavenger mRNA decapping enzyme n=1 Tax=Ascoidea rubescens DSM 1968 TaxID=1344418 RepID=A0A1D2VK02_9ASCO|nr:scavenger mRNA decapping enzyme [Ascoidea rubescens DSM 1968]ODV61928.1 scavenger mRNA decapping enzyme [Ascoidea rubescens DSM 1968]